MIHLHHHERNREPLVPLLPSLTALPADQHLRDLEYASSTVALRQVIADAPHRPERRVEGRRKLFALPFWGNTTTGASNAGISKL